MENEKARESRRHLFEIRDKESIWSPFFDARVNWAWRAILASLLLFGTFSVVTDDRYGPIIWGVLAWLILAPLNGDWSWLTEPMPTWLGLLIALMVYFTGRQIEDLRYAVRRR